MKRTRLKLSLVLFAVALASALTGLSLSLFGGPRAVVSYIGSFYFLAVLLFVGGCILLFSYLRRRYPTRFARVGRAVESAVIRFFEGIYRFGCRVLGIRRHALLLRGKDEGHFFSERHFADRKAGRTRFAGNGGWREEKTDFDRVRTLYRRFVESLIHTKGYRFRDSKTPYEIKHDITPYLSEKNGSELLVGLYTERRYAKNPKVTEEELTHCMRTRKHL